MYQAATRPETAMPPIESPAITPEAIEWAYRLFLDREPESAEVVEANLRVLRSTEDVRREFTSSEEYRQKSGGAGTPPQSPFFHYASAFDAEAVMRRHAAQRLEPRPGYLTNFLGVRIDPKFSPPFSAAGPVRLNRSRYRQTGMPTSRSGDPRCARSISPLGRSR